MDDLLMGAPAPKLKKRKAKKFAGKKPGAAPDPKHHGVHVHVNVVNSAGEGKEKKSNDADHALRNLRGY